MNRRRLLGLGAATLFPHRRPPLDWPPRWRALPDLPVERSEFQTARLGGSIVAAGGFDAGVRVDAFDTIDGSWRRLADLPFAVHHAGTAALGGLLYVIGGYDLADDRTSAAVAVYDPTADRWNDGPPLGVARGAFGCVATLDALYVLGGAADHLNGPALGGVERFDRARERWETIAALPTPREHLGAAAWNGVIYTAGGRANGDESTTFAAAVEALELANGRWRLLAPLPTPRAGLGVAVANGSIWTGGGERGPLVFATVEAFNPLTGAWSAEPPLPVARHGLGIAASANGVLYAFGGSTAGGLVASSVVAESLAPVGPALK